jgi:hypothetical protein
MMDQIRTKCGQKLYKEGFVSKSDCITTYLKGSYRHYILSGLSIKCYLVQLLDGVPFRDCFGKSISRSIFTNVSHEWRL